MANGNLGMAQGDLGSCTIDAPWQISCSAFSSMVGTPEDGSRDGLSGGSRKLKTDGT